MTIDKAIKILEDSFAAQPQFNTNPYSQAINLGIEALKQRQQDLEGNPLLDGELLPGETEGD